MDRRLKGSLLDPKFRRHCQEALAKAAFSGRKTISHSAREKLLDCGIDAPERLLFMTEEAIKSVPGLNENEMAGIRAYRAEFLR